MFPRIPVQGELAKALPFRTDGTDQRVYVQEANENLQWYQFSLIADERRFLLREFP